MLFHPHQDTDRLEKALTEMGIPVQLGVGTAVCKLCRYFANLLMKPPDCTKSTKAEFVKKYRKRCAERKEKERIGSFLNVYFLQAA